MSEPCSQGGLFMRYIRGCSVLLALVLLAGACGRSDDSADPGGADPTSTTAAADGDTLLANGGFGDLVAVCEKGDATGATAQGVTDTEIHVGTVSDKGGPVAGLNEEMYDTSVAFVKWCNEKGGINGRKLVLDDIDAKLFEYEAAITTACEKDFAVVGGGAVFDNDPNGVRVACGLPNIPSYVVSKEARIAELQVQPVPNPLDRIGAGRYQAVKREYPDALDHYGIMAGNLPSILLVRDQLLSVAKENGFTVDYNVMYAPTGETGWDNFAQEIKAKGIKILEYVGQPSDVKLLNQAFKTAGYYPDVLMLSTNFYDKNYATEAGAIAGNVYIQSAYYPFELAKDNKATQDFLDLMEQYNPDGKVAVLGTQGLSAWLLFARAASACGSELTPPCLIKNAGANPEWTAGGLHAPQMPGNTESSPCFLILNLDKDGFSYNAKATAPTDGDSLYNCDPKNVSDVSN